MFTVLVNVPGIIRQFGSYFTRKGYACYLVGGAVRDMVLGLKTTDFDFATDASPDEVMGIFKRVIPTGIKHGTVTVLFKGHRFEVTTFRVDGSYSDSRRPDNIAFTPSIFEDLKRRDFTVNAMAVDVETGVLLDPHNGKEDLDLRLIRAIGDPVKRFNEDALRILRACRFSSQLEFALDTKTMTGMAACKNKLSAVSSERIRDELEKILLSRQPSRAFTIMESTGVLSLILPELAACRGIQQKGFHDFDVLDHLLKACDASVIRLDLRLAALLHDIGKPEALSFDESGIPTFYRHEEISAGIAENILRRLKFPRVVEKKVVHLIAHHMFHYEDSWSDAAVRRFLRKVGTGNVEDLLTLRTADQLGMSENTHLYGPPSGFKKRIESVLEEDAAFTLKDLAVNGATLSAGAGIPKGPVMGTVLDFLLETVIDDPVLNKEETLLTIARNFYNERLKQQ